MEATFLTHLRNRGLVAQLSHDEELAGVLARGPIDEKGRRYAAYCGFDPTAKSMHVGNLVSLMGLRRAQDFGLTPVILFGGATGLIGDPTGRTEMRPMNTREQINQYIENFTLLARRYFRTDVPNLPVFVNNIDWIGAMSWIDFAREVGVHFTVARLLSAEVNKTRFEQGGLTYMELGYQLLQAFDFLHLNRLHNCVVQLGGNDQWSNILAGADLIRRVDQGKGFALTFPLLVDQAGNKFGKSAGNAIWLDGSMTPPYDFFQFFRNVSDIDVPLIMKIFTFFTEEEIARLTDKSSADINKSKEILAFEVTKLVHGTEAAQGALDAAHALFSGAGDLSNAPSIDVTSAELDAGLDLLGVLVKSGLSASRGEARKLIQGNGLTVNGEKITDAAYKPVRNDFETAHGALVLRKGKKDFCLVKIV